MYSAISLFFFSLKLFPSQTVQTHFPTYHQDQTAFTILRNLTYITAHAHCP